MTKKLKNPLNRRLPRELKSEFGKYLVIFLFFIMVISLVSGFLVADTSMHTAYLDALDKYNIEDGNFAYAEEASLPRWTAHTPGTHENRRIRAVEILVVVDCFRQTFRLFAQAASATTR